MTTNNESAMIAAQIKGLVKDRKVLDEQDVKAKIREAACTGVSPARARMRLHSAASALHSAAHGARGEERKLYEVAASLCEAVHAEVSGSAGFVGWALGHQRQDMRDTSRACLAEEANRPLMEATLRVAAAGERQAAATERVAIACEKQAAANEALLAEAREGRASTAALLGGLDATAARLQQIEAQLAALGGGGGAFRP